MNRRLPILLLVACGALPLVSCYDPNDYDLNQDQVKSILTVEVKQGNPIPADGFSISTLTARINPANANNRAIVVTTDRGTLMRGGASVNNGALTTSVGPDGSVDFDLRSGTDVGTATVVVTSMTSSQVAASTTVTFEQPNPDDTVRFKTVPASMPADGASQSTIEAQLNTSIPSSQRTATFKTTQGTVTPSDAVTPDADGVARVTLLSPASIGTARITVQTAGVIRQTATDFVRALPTTITASTVPTTVTASSSSAVDVTGQLSRTPGNVTDGTMVMFEAFRTDTRAAIGTFRNVTNSAQGRVGASFLPGMTDYRGDVELRISLTDRSVSGSTTIRIVSP